MITNRWLASIVAVALAGLVPASEPPKLQKGTTTLVGTIHRARINPAGAVKRVYIDVEERGLVLVSLQGKGREMAEHVGSRVEVKGFLKRSWDKKDDFDWVIDIDGFEVLPVEPAEDPVRDEPDSR